MIWVVSSAVEHCLHTAGVTGSIPVPPTRFEGPTMRRPFLHSASGLIDASVSCAPIVIPLLPSSALESCYPDHSNVGPGKRIDDPPIVRRCTGQHALRPKLACSRACTARHVLRNRAEGRACAIRPHRSPSRTSHVGLPRRHRDVQIRRAAAMRRSRQAVNPGTQGDARRAAPLSGLSRVYLLCFVPRSRPACVYLF